MKLLKPLQRIAVAILLMALAACATSSNRTYHSFEFRPGRESMGIEVLFYRYGSANEFGLRTTQTDEVQGNFSAGTSITGDLPVGDDLYVKWRDNKTGQIYEDTVDLKSRLPFNMRGQRIKPIIEGLQLYVYLISLDTVRPLFTSLEAAEIDEYAKNLRQKTLAPFARRKIIQIYPVRMEDPQLPPRFKK